MGAGGSSLQLGEPFLSDDTIWDQIVPCERKEEKVVTKGTLFVANRECGALADNAIRWSRRVRHPFVVAFIQTPPGSENGMITEPVKPLTSVTSTMSLDEWLAGLNSIIGAVQFIHDSVQLAHNNIGPHSVYVRANGCWALSGFEFASLLDEEPSTSGATFREECFKMVEKEKNGKIRDIVMFGKLIEWAAERLQFTEEEASASLQELSQLIIDDRPSLNDIKRHSALSSELGTLSTEIKNVPLFSEIEKQSFYENLVPRLRLINPNTVARQLCRSLLARQIMLEPLAHQHFYYIFLKPAVVEDDEGLLPADVFKKYLIPEIARIWNVRDVAIRLAMISYLPGYIQYMSETILERLVLSELKVGLTDDNKRLVSASYKGLSQVVLVLGTEIVLGKRGKKVFTDGTPKGQQQILFPEFTESAYSSSSAMSSEEEGNIDSPQNREEPSGRNESSSARNSNYIPDWKTLPISTNVTNVVATEESQPIVEESTDDWGGWGDDGDNIDMDEEARADLQTSVVPEVSKFEDLPQPKTKQEILLEQLTEKLSPREKPAQPIGAIDVKEVTIKSTEVDFFADMEPEIKTEGTIIDKLLKMKEQGAVATSKSPPPEATVIEDAPKVDLFAAKDTDHEDAESGWDADLSLDAYNGLDDD